METKIQDFQNSRDLHQCGSIILAASIILELALGQVCGCNALTGKIVFDSEVGPNVVPDFRKVASYLHTAFDAFNDAADALEKEGK